MQSAPARRRAKTCAAVHDFEGDQTYSEKPGHNFSLNTTFADVKVEDSRCSGHSRWARTGVHSPERESAEYGKALFTNGQAHCIDLSRRTGAGRSRGPGRKACPAYPAVGPDVTRAGGKYVDIPMDKAHVRQTRHRAGLARSS